MQFLCGIWKGQKRILTFRRRYWNTRFSVIWIFIEGEGNEIKSKQASKRNRTLHLFGWSGKKSSTLYILPRPPTVLIYYKYCVNRVERKNLERWHFCRFCENQIPFWWKSQTNQIKNWTSYTRCSIVTESLL